MFQNMLRTEDMKDCSKHLKREDKKIRDWQLPRLRLLRLHSSFMREITK